MFKYLILSIIAIVFYACDTSSKQLNENTGRTQSDQLVQFEEEKDIPSANWRNPVMSPFGADIGRIIRGYFLVGDYTKMFQFVITPECYTKKQLETIVRKSNWGYEMKFTNLVWQEDSTFIITYKVTKNNTTGSEQYIGRIVNDTAKIILFPEKENLFQYYGDENTNDLCEFKSALDGIYFEFDKSTILPKSRLSLNYILNYLKKKKSISAHFIGHCSNEGSLSHNQELSENRAEAICLFLEKNGIAKSRLSFEGKGDRMPISPNDSEENRSLNRRVEIVLSLNE